MADVEPMKKIVPFVTCEITFGQNVCESVFGINVSNLNFRIKIHPVKQPVQSNSVVLWHMPQCGTSAFYYHCSHGFIVHKNVEHRNQTKKTSRSTKHGQHYSTQDVVLGWILLFGFGCACLMWCHATSFLVLDTLVFFDCVGEEWNTSMTKYQKSRAGIPSMRKPASRDLCSASAEPCETEVCFLHIQLVGTNVWRPKMHKNPPDVDLESSRSPSKSQAWNNPNLHCCAVLPT